MQIQFIKPALVALYWAIEYLMALLTIIAVPAMAVASVAKLVREPSIGEVLWLVLWLALSIPVIKAGRYRWRVLDARRGK
jgi:hypothetical protein